MKISVIGLGKLGSCHAAVLAAKGYNVIGVDINEQFVAAINQGKAPVVEPDLQELISKNRERLTATTDTKEAISQTRASFVIVPTPSDSEGRFSMQYALTVAQAIGEGLRENNEYHVVVMTSTVMPGDMESKFVPALEAASGKKAGKDFGVCYNPEFIALGSVVRNMLYPDMVLIGESDKKAGDFIQEIYESSVENQPHFARMNFVNAELTKISINTYITTKISYANMLGQVCSRLEGADASVVLNAVGSDSRIGVKYLRAGLSFGGPCFPRDNIAFTKVAEDIGLNPILPKATDAMNSYHTDFVAETIMKAMSSGTKKVAILGLAYKPNTPVIDVSPSIALARQLVANGIEVSAYDPLALENAKQELPNINYSSDFKTTIADADVIVVTLANDEFKTLTPSHIKPTAKLIDCCALFDHKVWGTNLITLGKN